jgi:hypothetical protein
MCVIEGGAMAMRRPLVSRSSPGVPGIRTAGSIYNDDAWGIITSALVTQHFPLSTGSERFSWRCEEHRRTNSLLKKASEPGIASAARNSSESKANKKRDFMSHRASK